MFWAKEESCLVCRKRGRHDSDVGGTTLITCVGKGDIKTDVLERKKSQVYWEGRSQDRCVELGIMAA